MTDSLTVVSGAGSSGQVIPCCAAICVPLRHPTPLRRLATSLCCQSDATDNEVVAGRLGSVRERGEQRF